MSLFLLETIAVKNRKMVLDMLNLPPPAVENSGNYWGIFLQRYPNYTAEGTQESNPKTMFPPKALPENVGASRKLRNEDLHTSQLKPSNIKPPTFLGILGPRPHSGGIYPTRGGSAMRTATSRVHGSDVQSQGAKLVLPGLVAARDGPSAAV